MEYLTHADFIADMTGNDLPDYRIRGIKKDMIICELNARILEAVLEKETSIQFSIPALEESLYKAVIDELHDKGYEIFLLFPSEEHATVRISWGHIDPIKFF